MEMDGRDRLLTIQDIAARWRVNLRQAKPAAVQGGLPRIELKAGLKHISWSTTRFAMRDVEAWEKRRMRVAAEPAHEFVERVVLRKLR